MCYYDYMTLETRWTLSVWNFSCWGWLIGIRFSKFQDFSMTFYAFSKFHDFYRFSFSRFSRPCGNPVGGDTTYAGDHSPVIVLHIRWCWGPGGRFKNAYELLNLRALKISMLYKNHIFQCMSMIFCVEFQRVPLKFHTKYHTHTLKDVDFMRRWQFKSS